MLINKNYFEAYASKETFERLKENIEKIKNSL